MILCEATPSDHETAEVKAAWYYSPKKCRPILYALLSWSISQ